MDDYEYLFDRLMLGSSFSGKEDLVKSLLPYFIEAKDATRMLTGAVMEHDLTLMAVMYRG